MTSCFLINFGLSAHLLIFPLSHTPLYRTRPTMCHRLVKWPGPSIWPRVTSTGEGWTANPPPAQHGLLPTGDRTGVEGSPITPWSHTRPALSQRPGLVSVNRCEDTCRLSTLGHLAVVGPHLGHHMVPPVSDVLLGPPPPRVHAWPCGRMSVLWTPAVPLRHTDHISQTPTQCCG